MLRDFFQQHLPQTQIFFNERPLFTKNMEKEFIDEPEQAYARDAFITKHELAHQVANTPVKAKEPKDGIRALRSAFEKKITSPQTTNTAFRKNNNQH